MSRRKDSGESRRMQHGPCAPLKGDGFNSESDGHSQEIEGGFVPGKRLLLIK